MKAGKDSTQQDLFMTIVVFGFFTQNYLDVQKS